MKFGTSLLRSKVSRRLLVLFIVSGTFPVALFALLSFGYVNQQLVSYAQGEIQRASQSVGVEVGGRLAMAADELELISHLLYPIRDRVPQVNSKRLTEIATVQRNDMHRLWGVSPITDTEQRLLATGKTLLKLGTSHDGHPRIVLARRLGSGDSNTLLGAEVKRGFLFNGLARDDAEACITSDSGVVLSCSSALAPARLSRGNSTSELGLETEEGRLLTASWSLSLANRYGASDWWVLVAQSDSNVFFALRRFQEMFPVVIVISSLVILLLSMNQIRRQLIPLEKLREGTERLKSGDFSTAVEIESGDEFQALATSFNGMARHIRKQFYRLGTMAEVDRAILSTSDADYIVETLLGRIRQIVACDLTWILLIDKQDPHKAALRLHGMSQDTGPMTVTLRDEDLAELTRTKDTIELDLTRRLPGYLNRVSHHGMTHFLVLPVLIKETLAGVIGLGYRQAPALERDDLETVQELVNRAAVALSNAAWEEELYYQAHYDTLTDLPNRVLLKDRLEQAMSRAARNQDLVAVFIIDLDGFKTINDSLGHEMGDRYLVEISQRLKATVRAVDTLVRFSGDEFTLVVPDVVDNDRVGSVLSKIAKQLLAALEQRVVLDGHDIQLSGSIGIAVYPRDAESFDGLVSKADLAMYHAKTEGRNNFQFYSDDLNAAAIDRMKISALLRSALENHELELVFQPQVNMQTREIVGAECLLRWTHPTLGVVSPAKFIPVAEETGLIIPIGAWTIEAACAQNRQWQEQGMPPIRLAVNVSARQFRAGDLVAIVERALERNALDPKCLELEVTESTLAQDVEHTAATLRKLRDMGVQIAIDDFGTGYSSLNYLAQFPIDMLKIDQSFVKDLRVRPEVDTIVSAIIGLAHSLDLRVIAEGVETPRQLKFLRSHACEVLQGHLFSAPVPPEVFTGLRLDWGTALALDPNVTISKARTRRARRA